MTPKQRATLKNTLERLRAELVRAGPAKIQPNRTDAATTGVADEDAQALSEMLQVLASQRNKGQAELVARIDRALAKLASAPEDFGLCEDCEEEIAPGRLAVMPYATRCPACQAKTEPRLGAGRRKLTDYR
ncbi:TraR/DksA family transcriptional regulator [Anaeromyxobacter sp. Fw109-5]|uniref:TraR/DksA family transcriptional regulator n=1 Tax=Anaeromyxobacter sp. (strain Fw109-5) TaxID=404589 RepID=UPI0000ED8A96|nr:TraR/DksA family transcriptional regulator [Anaeromyxobacter sp. Fw109-5]ABS27262.1 transcriptional regulator, TraR/DksA family [Anaeromyxobacter sp. Fw109-5]